MVDDLSTASSRSTVSSLPSLGEVVITGGGSHADDYKYRAVHRVNLSAISHNYQCIEAAASKQHCSVIVVVKADGYGHGAIDTAIHLADSVGADAFAVATLEEAIHLRKTLEVTAKQTRRKTSSNFSENLGHIFAPLPDNGKISDVVSVTTGTSSGGSGTATPAANRRSAFIRILVLGPPVGFPRCFDDYYYHNIELMVSGQEVAKALLEWVANPLERQHRVVERAAQETKEQLSAAEQQALEEEEEELARAVTKSATLSGTSGNDLAREVRMLLLKNHQNPFKPIPARSQESSTQNSCTATPTKSIATASKSTATSGPAATQSFGGIEAAALSSRNREHTASKQVFVEDGANDSISVITAGTANPVNPIAKQRRLRWHALVDSGMGRLGFRTDIPTDGSRRDSVEVIRELFDAQVQGAPLEFFGMCTHMADANALSTYTNDQILRFKSLLKRVRDAGISVPTLSTDNSAALLTTTLTHFDPVELLTQKGMNTRGFVRTGGGIYGQRPAFSQLKAVSTLVAAVRHVATVKEGESVGYDRAYIARDEAKLIATLTIGFADGYPRELGNGKGKVSIRNRLYPVAGNVCMDMTMVELGPASQETVICVGDVAVLWGDGGVPLVEIAATLNTTQSALTCGLNKTRVLRELVL